MKQTPKTAAPLTVRDVPAPLGVCDSCGATPALPVSGSDRCPACMRRDMLTDAAAEHLRELLSPLLGLWAGHWESVGVPAEELESILETESGADLNDKAAATFRRVSLRFLRRKYRPAPYVDTSPERHTVRLLDLPSITERREADPSRGVLYPYFLTDAAAESERVYAPAPGADLLTVDLPDGSAALLPLGKGGGLEFERLTRHAVRIPAHLRDRSAELYTPAHKLHAEERKEA